MVRDWGQSVGAGALHALVRGAVALAATFVLLTVSVGPAPVATAAVVSGRRSTAVS